MSMPTRIDAELFQAAQSIGAAQSRSAAQQITHWARIGREFEASASVSHRALSRVLAGIDPYDGIGEREQAIVRAEWDAATGKRLAALDLAAEFGASGESWAEADASGRLVARSPSST